VVGSSEPGAKLCTCFQSASKSDDTQISESPAGPMAKVCAVCGKDVSGHRRFKDSRGYICRECNQAEKAADREGKVQCPDCKRYIKPAGLIGYKGRLVCRSCKEGHDAVDGKKPKIVSSKKFDEAEKQSIVKITVLLAILVILMIIGWFKMKHGS
jgi:hypothetical protein